MEVTKQYFFDSYAVIEILKFNPNYLKYSNVNIVITTFNLVEICWSVLLDFGEEKMQEIYNRFKDCVYELDEPVIINAIKFRKKYKNRDLSYTDCIGYIFAKQNNLIFLTGDKEFKDLPNVEFVK